MKIYLIISNSARK